MTIEQRIERLEVSNQRYRWAMFAMVAAVAVAICVGAADDDKGDELVLKKLAIQDEHGRDRIVMDGTDANGNASVSHLDANEKTRILAYTDTDGSAGTIHYDANGKAQ